MRHISLRTSSRIIALALFLALVCGMASTQIRVKRPGARLSSDLQFECEQLKVLEVSPGDTCEKFSMTAFGSEWSQNAILWFRPGRAGGAFSVELPINTDGSYSVFIHFTKAPDYGIVQTSLDDKPLGSPFDAYSENVTRSEQVALGPASLAAGAHRLSFQITGKNDKSVGYMAGPDIVILQRTGGLEGPTAEPAAKKPAGDAAAKTEGQRTAPQAEKVKRPGLKPDFKLQTRPTPTKAAGSLRLMRPLAERMTQLGAQDTRALMSACSSRENVLALSRQARLTASEILLTAQEAELAQVLGSSFTAQSADLLRMMNIVRPEDFASFAGREGALEASAHRWAARFGMAPPPASTLQQWMKSAQGKRSELRAASELLPEATLKKAVYREVVLGDAIPDRTTVEKARRSEQEEDYGLTEEQLNATITALTQQHIAAGADQMTAQANAQSVVLGQLNIKAGEKNLTRRFDAPSPGLYLLHIQMKRPGGRATLKWSVERPSPSYKPQMMLPSPSQPTIAPDVAVRERRRAGSAVSVSGYNSILTGAETLSASDPAETYYVYFWLDQEDLHRTFRPRIRLEVLENLTAKIVSTGIDTVKKDVPEDGPIVGSFSVQRYTVAAQPKKQVELKFSETPGYPNSRPPIQAVEMDYQPSAELHKDFTLPGLDLVLEEKAGQRSDLLLLCNSVPVTQTSGFPIDKGYRYRYTGAKTGRYTALVGRPEARPDVNILRTDGQVYSMLTEIGSYPALEPVKLTFDGEGVHLPIAYVAELRKLQVGDQSEPGSNEGDDDGDGEFWLRSTVTRLKSANMTKIWTQQQKDADKNKSWALFDAWPTWGGKVSIPSPNDTVFPHWAVASWTDESLENLFDQYSVTFSLVEEDHPPQGFWEDLKMGWDFLMGLKDAFIAAWTFDYVEATQKLVETAIRTTVAAMQTKNITNYWDIIGYPGLVFDRDLADKFRKDDTWECVTSQSRGPAERNMAITRPKPFGFEIMPDFSYTGNWAQTDVTIRKVPTYWGSGDARLVNFALNQDIPDKQEIWVVWEPIVHYCSFGYCTDPFDDYEALDQYYWSRSPHKFAVPPAGQVLNTPNCWFMPVDADAGYRDGIAATYLEFRMYCVNPSEGFGEIFRFSRTFYPCDFVKYAAPDEASAKPLPPDLVGMGELLEMGGKVDVRFFKRGSDYVGRFKIENPGGYLSQMEFEVTFHIFGA